MNNPKGMSEILENDRIEKCSVWFKRFGEQSEHSKIYSFLSKKISDDQSLLNLISKGNFEQPIPNLFFASIKLLVERDKSSRLRSYYPCYGGNGLTDEMLFENFKEFVFANESEVILLCNSRLVQTNEVRRSTLFAKSLAHICEKMNIQEVGLLDLGCSGGLNLLFDRYLLKYSDGTQLGDKDSSLELSCEVRETHQKRSLVLPRIRSRVGFDPNPLDLLTEDDRDWALSLIWPDQLERIDNFKRALEIRSHNSLDLQKGSSYEDIEPALRKMLVSQLTPIFMHSFTFNQLDKTGRESFRAGLMELSTIGRILELGIEWLGTETPELSYIIYENGGMSKPTIFAECDQHGQWIKLK